MAQTLNNMYLINAPAGSGKTTYIENTILDLTSKYPERKILCITYTNRAKEELEHRIDNKNVVVNTIHSFVLDFISVYFSKPEVISLFFDLFQDKIIKDINKGEQEPKNQRYIEKYGELNIETIKANITAISYNEQSFSSYYYGKISHDDLLFLFRQMMEKFPVLEKRLSNKYSYIFIDECQDASADVLFVFYNAVLNTNSELYLLGDKMQEIYNNYNGSFDCVLKLFDTSLSLRKNHRCSDNIVAILNKIYNDNEFEQEPATSIKGEQPQIIITESPENEVKNHSNEYMLLYLFNRKRFDQIGASDIYDAVYRMSSYSFSSKYGPVDVLTNKTFDNPDKLFRVLFCICDFIDLIETRKYGACIQLARNKKKIFNSELTKINFHIDKIEFANKAKDIIEKFNSSELSIKEFCDYLIENGYCINKEFEQIFENTEYEAVLNCKIEDMRKLYKYLGNPHVSTQHGVKGEGHDKVCFIAEDSSRTPVTHMYDFFHLFCTQNINLTDFQKFYYDFIQTTTKVDELGIISAAIYNTKKQDCENCVKEVYNTFAGNKYFEFCYKEIYEKYFSNSNYTNFKNCFKTTKVQGTLWAYKLFYVGCSRAKKDLVIIVDKTNVSNFMQEFIDKMQNIGFKVNTN